MPFPVLPQAGIVGSVGVNYSTVAVKLTVRPLSFTKFLFGGPPPNSLRFLVTIQISNIRPSVDLKRIGPFSAPYRLSSSPEHFLPELSEVFPLFFDDCAYAMMGLLAKHFPEGLALRN